MPITSPSYFPPNRANGTVVGTTAGRNQTGAACFLGGQSAGDNSTVANLVIIGDNSGKGGIIDVANLTGTTIVGAQSGQAVIGATAAIADGALTILGSGNLKNAASADSSVIIGQGILPLTTDAAAKVSQNILIGNGIASDVTTTGPGSSVIIGYHAQQSTGNSSSTNNVVIGANAFNTSAGSCVDNVFIGFNVIPVAALGPAQNVVIGSGTSIGATSSSNTIIGFQATSAGTANTGSNTGVGTSCSANTAGDLIGHNVVLGFRASVPTAQTTGMNVIIGPNAGKTLTGASGVTGNLLVIETNVDGLGAQKSLLFGSFASGNLILGNSLTAVNQDFGGVPGTNILKLLNGTKSTGTNIIGGGYFYVSAGILHWVDSAGNDIDFNGALATGASTASFVATNKPGATTGAGPVQWLNVVVNGTSYQQPLWAT